MCGFGAGAARHLSDGRTVVVRPPNEPEFTESLDDRHRSSAPNRRPWPRPPVRSGADVPPRRARLVRARGDHRRPHLAALLGRTEIPGPPTGPPEASRRRSRPDSRRRSRPGRTRRPRGCWSTRSTAPTSPGAGSRPDAWSRCPWRPPAPATSRSPTPASWTGSSPSDPACVKALVRYNVEADPTAERRLRGGARRAAGPTRPRRTAAHDRGRRAPDAGAARRHRRPRRSPAPGDRPWSPRPSPTSGPAAPIPTCGRSRGSTTPPTAAEVAAAARAGGGIAGLVVLGAGAPARQVGHWLRVAAGTPGYVGFAVGRSLWWDEIRDLLAGRRDR